MKKVYLSIIFLGFSIFTFAQETKVKNIDINIENNKVIVKYDLIGDSLSLHDVELFFIDDQYSISSPKKLNGDYGRNINAGLNKKIEWDVFDDDIAIAQKLQAKIIVDGIKKGGPKNALYSVLVPGLGDYFVKDTKSMIIKPYMRTTATLGLVALGIIANQNRERYYTTSTAYKSNGWRNPEGEFKEIYDGYEYDYWLFKNDAEIFLISGVTLWIADIIWVYAKGTENDRLRMYSNFSFNASLNNNFTNFGLTYKF